MLLPTFTPYFPPAQDADDGWVTLAACSPAAVERAESLAAHIRLDFTPRFDVEAMLEAYLLPRAPKEPPP